MNIVELTNNLLQNVELIKIKQSVFNRATTTQKKNKFIIIEENLKLLTNEAKIG